MYTVLDSWWWTGNLSETCRVLFLNKFEKLVYLVFIIKMEASSQSHAPAALPPRKNPGTSFFFFFSPGMIKIWAAAITVCLEKHSAHLETHPKRDSRTKCNTYCTCCLSALNITYCQAKYLPARTPSLFHSYPSVPYVHPNNAWPLPILRNTKKRLPPKR